MNDQTETDAIRLNMTKAVARIETDLKYTETGQDKLKTIKIIKDDLISTCGDIVLARKDIGTSYHLSVVVDDAEQNITHVTRGLDLAPATPIHVVLQKLLGLPTPIYHHHKLIRDENGKRLAKRDDARSIRSYRDAGLSPTEVLALVGLQA